MFVRSSLVSTISGSNIVLFVGFGVAGFGFGVFGARLGFGFGFGFGFSFGLVQPYR